MHWCVVRHRQGHQQTTERTREGPDVFPRGSLPDRTGIEGGGHGAEGKDRRNKSKTGLRFYGVEECISGIRNVCDLGSTTGAGLPPLEVWPVWPENLLAEDYNVCQ